MSHKDPEVRRAYLRAWRDKNKDKINKYNRTWKKKNPKAHASSVMKQRYGITHAERDALIAKQKNRCALCGTSEVKRWHVDHCHKTKVVRGVLCHNCNVGLGHFQDQPRLLRKALVYLTKGNL